MRIPRRCVIGCCVVVAVCCAEVANRSGFCAAAQGAPTAPTGQSKTSRASATDTKARDLILQMIAAYKSLRSYSGTMNVREQYTTTILWQRPNQFAVRTTFGDGTEGRTFSAVSDGRNVFVVSLHDSTQYSKQAVPAQAGVVLSALDIGGVANLGLPYLLATHGRIFQEVMLESSLNLSVGSTTMMDGVPVVSVLLTAQAEKSAGQSGITLFIGQHDHLLRRLEYRSRQGERMVTNIETHSNVRANRKLPASSFTFVPPPGAKVVASVAPLPFYVQFDVGGNPPALRAKDLTGSVLSLEQYKGKVVLLDFWATWCAPCVQEMPNVIAAYDKFKRRGFDIIGITLDADRNALTSYIRKNKVAWRQVRDSKDGKAEIASLYGVSGIPFTLLIGRDGKIAAVNPQGAELEPAIRAALSKTGK